MSDICIGVKKDGNNCSFKKKIGNYCGVHAPKITSVLTPSINTNTPTPIILNTTYNPSFPIPKILGITNIPQQFKLLQPTLTESKTNPKIFRQEVFDPPEHGPAITITFSSVVENHVGMEKIGIERGGYSVNELIEAKEKLEKLGAICEYINLNDALIGSEYENKGEEAGVLIIRNGVDLFLEGSGLTADDMWRELNAFPWDNKYFDRRRGRVLNKHARENVCFGDQSQIADFEHAKGTVIAFDSVPATKIVREKLPFLFGEKSDALLAEGNRYVDVSTGGIHAHGDKCRPGVIGMRIGKNFPLHFHWFHRSNPIGLRVQLKLNNKDMYIMSSKAVGRDWRSPSKITLRHMAGAPKYLMFKPKKEK